MYRLRLYLPITLALFLSLGMLATDASAANRYWVGSTSPDNWADDANWSASSGNSCGSGGGASYPTGADTAIFTSDCENDVTLDAAVTVGAITNTGGYTGTFTLAGYDVDVSGNFQWDGGMFDASTGTPTITVGGDWDSSAGTFNYGTSTVKMIGINKTFKPSGWPAWTWNLTIGDGVNPASVTVLGGNWRYVAANDLVLADNAGLTLTAVFDYLPATGNLTLGTGATLDISINLTRRINDSSSHISTTGAFGGAGTFQYDIVAGSVAAPVTARTYGTHLAVSGPLNATGVLGGGASLDLGTKTLYMYDRNTNNNTYGILDNPGNIPVTAAALQVGATGGGNQPWKTGKLICRGAVYTFTNVTVYSSNTAAPTIDCSTGGQSSVWNVSGNVTIDDVRTYKGLITAGSSTWTVGGDWANTPGGTFTPGTSTVTFNGSGDQAITSGGAAFNNLTLNNPGSAFTINGDLDVDGNLTITNGDLKIDTYNPNVNTAGNVIIEANGSITKGTGTWTFDGITIFTDNSTTGPQNLGTVKVD